MAKGGSVFRWSLRVKGPSFGLVLEFLRRELRLRFAGSISGGLWALFQPLMQIAVYSFVFVHIFKSVVPGANAPAFVPFLAVAMWPWFAFSEALQRATTVIQENASLIGKVAIPREVLVLASVAASFLVHVVGFCFVLVVLGSIGTPLQYQGLIPALLLMVPLFILALGLSLMLASFQVFVRDLAQAIGQIIVLLMFTAPILYARVSVHPSFAFIMDLHPFTFYAESMRSLVLGYGEFDPIRLLKAVAVALVALFIGYRVFRRLDPHFEDFL